MNPTDPRDDLSAQLNAAHAAVNAGHARERQRLLARLPSPRPAGPRTSWRYVLGGVSFAASLAIAVFWFMATSSPVAAMERMAQALDEVNTYVYRMESVHVSQQSHGRTVRQVNAGRWRTKPFGLRAHMTVDETLGTSTPQPSSSERLVDLEESHQATKRGIIVDHLARHFWWIDEQVDAKSLGTPHLVIYMVRQRRGRVLRDLGEAERQGRRARGLEIILDQEPASELGADPTREEASEWRNTKIEVWVDLQTHLPIEFGWVRRGDDFETSYRFTELAWNVEFPPQAFLLEPSEGYEELSGAPWGEQE